MRKLDEKMDEKKAAPAGSEREQLEEVKRELSRLSLVHFICCILNAIVIFSLCINFWKLSARIDRFMDFVLQLADAVTSGNAVEADLLEHIAEAIHLISDSLNVIFGMTA